MVVVSFAYAQKSDPLYSASNYKHPDKAEYAKKHNLDRRTKLGSVTVESNTDYKHPKAKKTSARKSTIASSRGMNPAASHKHPLGF